MKLLVADDEMTTRIFLNRTAKRWGYEVVEASDGNEAWDALMGDDPPRIAILDWMMPGMNGVDICKRLGEKSEEIMIYTILLTSKTEKEDIVHALDSGAHDYLTKPVHIGELRSRVAVGRRLIDANDKLKELNQLKNKFLGIAAHDLRSPLSFVINMVDMITTEDFAISEEDQVEFLSLINTTSRNMLELVNNLLDVSVIESGYLEVDKQPDSLKEVIAQSIRTSSHLAWNKNMEINADLGELPLFPFDRKRILQVFDNLFSNAVKYSPIGSLIKVKLEKREDMAYVGVTDQGPGISGEDRKKLFGEFQRLGAKPTGNEVSTGLGLAIAKKIIDAHGGKIEVESQLNQGSTFAFLIPLEWKAGADEA